MNERDHLPDKLVDRIICGDCIDLMRDLLPDNCIDLSVTSPPYDNIRSYEGYISYFDFEAIAEQIYRVTAPGGVVVWVVSDQTKDFSESGTSFKQALHFKDLGFLLFDTMIYKRSSPFPPNVRYWQEFEYMFVLSKGRPKTFNPLWQPKQKSTMERQKHRFNTFVRNRDGEQTTLSEAGHARMKKASERTMRIKSNVWEYAVGGGSSYRDDVASGHPAAFPECLARDHILSWSNPGDVCFDPMCGSGTTMKMAKLLNRRYLGFEVVPAYAELANQRLSRTERPLLVA